MPNQDLLFPILPRAPATPGSDAIRREVNPIDHKHQTHEIGTERDGGQGTPQESPRSKTPPPPSQGEVDEQGGHKPDPDHKIDLFV
ncbi:hypothetical protein [Aeromonas molluscorum]|jgi:hypothetical protein|uniref:Uncharacterized protein n=1 Tax=Aeromonas molluscorum 848 TaxID=1268236 RepID=R1H4J6_9GAMM|nr:hypothetical protein [Aeromonas molluscorum]EOD53394.1 hypothetical protein G113_19873 [Aeromonas molluscorum 848]